MEIEKEIKVLGADYSDVKKKILELGGQKISEEQQVNIRLQNKKNPVPEEEGYLRLRKVTQEGKAHYEFTFKAKEKTTGSKNNVEYTTKVEDGEQFLEILNFMGIEEIGRGQKKREKYKLPGAVFDFDTWDKDTYPDPYMEIEVEEEEKLQELVELLGIQKHQISTLSIGELKKEYQKK